MQLEYQYYKNLFGKYLLRQFNSFYCDKEEARILQQINNELARIKNQHLNKILDRVMI